MTSSIWLLSKGRLREVKPLVWSLRKDNHRSRMTEGKGGGRESQARLPRGGLFPQTQKVTETLRMPGLEGDVLLTLRAPC